VVSGAFSERRDNINNDLNGSSSRGTSHCTSADVLLWPRMLCNFFGYKIASGRIAIVTPVPTMVDGGLVGRSRGRRAVEAIPPPPLCSLPT